MKTFVNFLLLVVFLIPSTVLLAQNEEGDDDMEYTGPKEGDENMYVNDIVEKRLTVENRAVSYEPIREADIAWEKRMWRVIETREKMNLPFRYPGMPLFNVFKQILENGDIVAFEDEEFKQPLSFEDIDKKLNRIDTTVVYDPETYEEKIVVVKNEIDWSTIMSYRISEIWFFDEEASMLRCQIMGIAPIHVLQDDEGGYSLPYPLFWIHYKSSRDALAKYRVFNDNNDMAPMTWTDLFDSRFFSSYIIKRSNVLDERVINLFDPNDERTPINALLESEKIKQELFNFEHDLWEY
ncbi:MAG TPA: gliding motility protein GldN [Saprospiraceae bacterium]|nr:gliding motility protein GldN [Saprospiraceae bacterium]MCB9327505.1 gliding motility protein GldN [Lewinellaceae bacterium]HPK09206.1 gliding motility protein GldN [Saprospiraceae bacterium]HPQ22222.1 gliding motility protein GldN [Saprospiraceae bacterium]HRX28472.1 gliding motility protein GldN [Saprospiraceae bacterium]